MKWDRGKVRRGKNIGGMWEKRYEKKGEGGREKKEIEEEKQEKREGKWGIFAEGKIIVWKMWEEKICDIRYRSYWEL